MRNLDQTRCLARKSGRVVPLLIMLLALCVVAAQASASTVRGQLFRVTPQGQRFPATGIPVNVVAVSNPALGASGLSYSDGQGMYYLFNIPPGAYMLQVWLYPNTPPWAFKVTVYNQPFTDIPPIQVP